MAGLGDPLGSMGMGASDALGLTASAQQSAKELGEKLKKKKLEEQKMMNTSGVNSAFQDLMVNGVR